MAVASIAARSETSGRRAHAHHHHGHSHGHSHAAGASHSHGHPHGVSSPVGRLRAALLITAIFLIAEVVGGLVSNSLALLADAGHMLADVAALALSLFVAWFSQRPSTPQKTYGYLRWEVLAAFINGAALLLISALIIWESLARIRHPEALRDGLMLAVAVIGLGVNLASAWILRPTGTESLNVRGAYLHVLGDLLGSVATLGAALVIRWTGWLTADPRPRCS